MPNKTVTFYSLEVTIKDSKHAEYFMTAEHANMVMQTVNDRGLSVQLKKITAVIQSEETIVTVGAA